MARRRKAKRSRSVRRAPRAAPRASRGDNKDMVRVGVWAALAIVFIVLVILFLMNRFG